MTENIFLNVISTKKDDLKKYPGAIERGERE